MLFFILLLVAPTLGAPYLGGVKQEEQTMVDKMLSPFSGLVGPLFHQGDTYLETVPTTPVCYHDGITYQEGEQIMTVEPCLNCTCLSGMLMCYLKVCPFTRPISKGCTIEKKPGECCPTVTCPMVPVSLQIMQMGSTTSAPTTTEENTALEIAPGPNVKGCFVDEKFYADGAMLPIDESQPCTRCYCIRNHTSCIMQECTLHINACEPVYVDGVCCPVKYDCEMIMPTAEPPTTTFLSTMIDMITSTPPPPTSGCTHNGTFYRDGEVIDTPNPCEHCYCLKNESVCAIEECNNNFDPDISNCKPIEPPTGTCCPQVYDCDRMSLLSGRSRLNYFNEEDTPKLTRQQRLNDGADEEYTETPSPLVKDSTISEKIGDPQQTLPETGTDAPVTEITDDKDVTSEPDTKAPPTTPTTPIEDIEDSVSPQTEDPVEKIPTEPTSISNITQPENISTDKVQTELPVPDATTPDSKAEITTETIDISHVTESLDTKTDPSITEDISVTDEILPVSTDIPVVSVKDTTPLPTVTEDKVSGVIPGIDPKITPTDDTTTEAPTEMETELPIDTETEPPSPSATDPSVLSQTESSVSSETEPSVIRETKPSAPNATEPSVSITPTDDTTTEASTEIETELPIETETEPPSPSATDPSVLSQTEPSVSSETEPSVIRETKPSAPSATEPSVSEDTETPISSETEPSILSETEAPIPSLTESPILGETESSILSETEPSILSETESSVHTETEPTAKIQTEPSVSTGTEPSFISETETEPSIEKETETEPSIAKETETEPSIAKETETEPSIERETEPSVESETEPSVLAETESSVPTEEETFVPSKTKPSVSITTDSPISSATESFTGSEVDGLTEVTTETPDDTEVPITTEKDSHISTETDIPEQFSPSTESGSVSLVTDDSIIPRITDPDDSLTTEIPLSMITDSTVSSDTESPGLEKITTLKTILMPIDSKTDATTVPTKINEILTPDQTTEGVFDPTEDDEVPKLTIPDIATDIPTVTESEIPVIIETYSPDMATDIPTVTEAKIPAISETDAPISLESSTDRPIPTRTDAPVSIVTDDSIDDSTDTTALTTDDIEMTSMDHATETDPPISVVTDIPSEPEVTKAAFATDEIHDMTTSITPTRTTSEIDIATDIPLEKVTDFPDHDQTEKTFEQDATTFASVTESDTNETIVETEKEEPSQIIPSDYTTSSPVISETDIPISGITTLTDSDITDTVIEQVTDTSVSDSTDLPDSKGTELPSVAVTDDTVEVATSTLKPDTLTDTTIFEIKSSPIDISTTSAPVSTATDETETEKPTIELEITELPIDVETESSIYGVTEVPSDLETTETPSETDSATEKDSIIPSATDVPVLGETEAPILESTEPSKLPVTDSLGSVQTDSPISIIPEIQPDVEISTARVGTDSEITTVSADAETTEDSELDDQEGLPSTPSAIEPLLGSATDAPIERETGETHVMQSTTVTVITDDFTDGTTDSPIKATEEPDALKETSVPEDPAQTESSIPIVTDFVPYITDSPYEQELTTVSGINNDTTDLTIAEKVTDIQTDLPISSQTEEPILGTTVSSSITTRKEDIVTEVALDESTDKDSLLPDYPELEYASTDSPQPDDATATTETSAPLPEGLDHRITTPDKTTDIPIIEDTEVPLLEKTTKLPVSVITESSVIVSKDPKTPPMIHPEDIGFNDTITDSPVPTGTDSIAPVSTTGSPISSETEISVVDQTDAPIAQETEPEESKTGVTDVPDADETTMSIDDFKITDPAVSVTEDVISTRITQTESPQVSVSSVETESPIEMELLETSTGTLLDIESQPEDHTAATTESDFLVPIKTKTSIGITEEPISATDAALPEEIPSLLPSSTDSPVISITTEESEPVTDGALDTELIDTTTELSVDTIDSADTTESPETSVSELETRITDPEEEILDATTPGTIPDDLDAMTAFTTTKTTEKETDVEQVEVTETYTDIIVPEKEMASTTDTIGIDEQTEDPIATESPMIEADGTTTPVSETEITKIETRTSGPDTVMSTTPVTGLKDMEKESQTTISPEKDVDIDGMQAMAPGTDSPPAILTEGQCIENQEIYEDGESMKSTDPCSIDCYCFNGTKRCEMISCHSSPPSNLNCISRRDASVCCPEYECPIPDPTNTINACERDNITYSHFELVPDSDPCKLCYCVSGLVVCAIEECNPPASNCQSTEHKTTSCCPTKYVCDETTAEVTTIPPSDVTDAPVLETTTGSAQIDDTERPDIQPTEKDLPDTITDSSVDPTSTDKPKPSISPDEEPTTIATPTDDREISTDSSIEPVDTEAPETESPVTELPIIPTIEDKPDKSEVPGETTTAKPEDISTDSPIEPSGTEAPESEIPVTELPMVPIIEDKLEESEVTNETTTEKPLDISTDSPIEPLGTEEPESEIPVTELPMIPTIEDKLEETEVTNETTTETPKDMSTDSPMEPLGTEAPESEIPVTELPMIPTIEDKLDESEVTDETTTEKPEDIPTEDLTDAVDVTTPVPSEISPTDTVTSEDAEGLDSITDVPQVYTPDTTDGEVIIPSVTEQIGSDASIPVATDKVSATDEPYGPLPTESPSETTDSSIPVQPVEVTTSAQDTTATDAVEVPVDTLPEEIEKITEVPIGIESTTAIDATQCIFNATVYENGEPIPSLPCEDSCTCENGTVKCIISVCPSPSPIENCTTIQKEGACCPEYDCVASTDSPFLDSYCFNDGEYYEHNAVVDRGNPCNDCRCRYGKVVCGIRECEPPPLRCTPLPTRADACCPDKFECETTFEEVTDKTVISPTTDPSSATISQTTPTVEEVTKIDSLDLTTPADVDQLPEKEEITTGEAEITEPTTTKPMIIESGSQVKEPVAITTPTEEDVTETPESETLVTTSQPSDDTKEETTEKYIITVDITETPPSEFPSTTSSPSKPSDGTQEETTEKDITTEKAIDVQTEPSIEVEADQETTESPEIEIQTESPEIEIQTESPDIEIQTESPEIEMQTESLEMEVQTESPEIEIQTESPEAEAVQTETPSTVIEDMPTATSKVDIQPDSTTDVSLPEAVTEKIQIETTTTVSATDIVDTATDSKTIVEDIQSTVESTTLQAGVTTGDETSGTSTEDPSETKTEIPDVTTEDQTTTVEHLVDDHETTKAPIVDETTLPDIDSTITETTEEAVPIPDILPEIDTSLTEKPDTITYLPDTVPEGTTPVPESVTETITEVQPLKTTTTSLGTEPTTLFSSEKEEQPGTEIPEISNSCIYFGREYEHKETIKPASPCEEHCYCNNGTRSCILKACPNAPASTENCKVTELDGECCSLYECEPEPILPGIGCITNSSIYGHNEVVNSDDNCTLCKCVHGTVVCAERECVKPRDNCIPIVQRADECCPSQYECEDPVEPETMDILSVSLDTTESPGEATTLPDTSQPPKLPPTRTSDPTDPLASTIPEDIELTTSKSDEIEEPSETTKPVVSTRITEEIPDTISTKEDTTDPGTTPEEIASTTPKLDLTTVSEEKIETMLGMELTTTSEKDVIDSDATTIPPETMVDITTISSKIEEDPEPSVTSKPVSTTESMSFIFFPGSHPNETTTEYDVSTDVPISPTQIDKETQEPKIIDPVTTTESMSFIYFPESHSNTTSTRKEEEPPIATTLPPQADTDKPATESSPTYTDDPPATNDTDIPPFPPFPGSFPDTGTDSAPFVPFPGSESADNDTDISPIPPYPAPSSSTTSTTTEASLPVAPGACLFDGKVYVSAQQIPRDDPCDFCFCFRGDIICLQQSCPPPIPGCYEETIPGFCCPRYECPVKKHMMNITTTEAPVIQHQQQLQQNYDKTSRSASCEIGGKFYDVGEPVEEANTRCLSCKCGEAGYLDCLPLDCGLGYRVRRYTDFRLR